jgi:MurNAc alpha-1-phosphate uridylyltransferase
MILAAGRGERMRPLTDETPKPLLKVGGKSLLVWQLEALARAGHTHIAINAAWLSEQLVREIGDGSRYGVTVHWSLENPALETAGGIAHARHLFAPQPILIVSADILTRFDYARLNPHIARMAQGGDTQVHLVMVPNPPYHPDGDFWLANDRLVAEPADGSAERLTYGNIGIYRPELFAHLDPDRPAKLSPLFSQWIADGIVSAERFNGEWANIGTPADLTKANFLNIN